MIDSVNTDDGFGQVPRPGMAAMENAVEELRHHETLPPDEKHNMLNNIAESGHAYELSHATQAARELIYSLLKLGVDDNHVVAVRDVYQALKGLRDE